MEVTCASPPAPTAEGLAVTVRFVRSTGPVSTLKLALASIVRFEVLAITGRPAKPMLLPMAPLLSDTVLAATSSGFAAGLPPIALDPMVFA